MQPRTYVGWIFQETRAAKPAYRVSYLREALKQGHFVSVYQPGLGTVPQNGKITLEGPHFPAPHRWYAQGTMKDDKLVKVS